MPTTYQALLLDLDGTLVDSRADLVSAVNHTLKHLGHPAQTQAEIVPRIGNGLRWLLRESIGMTDQAELLRAKDVFESYYADHCLDETVLYDGVESAVRELSNKIKLGVVTNKPHAFAVKILDSFGFHPYLKVVIGGDSLPTGKPDPAPLRAAMEKMGADSKSTLMVGDGHQDIEGGQAAGIKTCLVRYGFGYREELLKLKPDHIIERFEDLKEIVK